MMIRGGEIDQGDGGRESEHNCWSTSRRTSKVPSWLRRRERRILLSLLYSWRRWEKALEEVDMLFYFLGE